MTVATVNDGEGAAAGVPVQSGVTYTIFGYGLLQGQPTFRVQAVVDSPLTRLCHDRAAAA